MKTHYEINDQFISLGILNLPDTQRLPITGMQFPATSVSFGREIHFHIHCHYFM